MSEQGSSPDGASERSVVEAPVQPSPAPPHAANSMGDDATFKAAVIEHAEFLGMRLPRDERFLWLAEEALVSEVQPPWVQYSDDGDHPYYFNNDTGESSWENPMDMVFRAKFETLRAEETSETPRSTYTTPRLDDDGGAGGGGGGGSEEDGGGGEAIEGIIEHRITEGVVSFKVHWRNTGAEEDEWFYREDLLDE